MASVLAVYSVDPSSNPTYAMPTHSQSISFCRMLFMGKRKRDNEIFKTDVEKEEESFENLRKHFFLQIGSNWFDCLLRRRIFLSTIAASFDYLNDDLPEWNRSCAQKMHWLTEACRPQLRPNAFYFFHKTSIAGNGNSQMSGARSSILESNLYLTSSCTGTRLRYSWQSGRYLQQRTRVQIQSCAIFWNFIFCS